MPKKKPDSQQLVPVEIIERRILLIRGHKVMLDSHLAELYEVTTSNLNRLGLWGILWQHKPPKTSAERPRKPLVAPKERNG